ncbi:hypothetical protein AJ80_00774 [Polytolypa hystricis UAMH7299]|uniref:UDP-N-acetylglucosamine transferase subunit ALG14 n=1 Tax=Polytolypa hystricis (strain UAMH7299) TaxID=1447883 RepID=A0A2B7Z2T3_POLH7|nr:hypothetical protein AJ80_00774 [Polytolypa hystricis UAMH7299]
MATFPDHSSIRGWQVPSLTTTLTLISIAILTIVTSFLLLVFYTSNNAPRSRSSTGATKWPIHILIVLGSGGHTAEMLLMLQHAPLDPTCYTHRTYVVSSGDSFSSSKAVEFEQSLASRNVSGSNGSRKHLKEGENSASSTTCLESSSDLPYSIITVPRARRVHQSLLTAPISTLHCLWACFLVLQGKHPEQRRPAPQSPDSSRTQQRFDIQVPTGYPDIILTNGPATAVCIILAAKILRLLNSIFPHIYSFLRRSAQRNFSSPPPPPPPPRPRSDKYLRIIFVESWARVTTLSLSGKLVLPLVDRFLVQWDTLEGYSSLLGGKAEYAGTLVA